MAGKEVIVICRSGGEFVSDKDGSLSYRGGDAHAMEIDDQMKYKDLKIEVAEMFNYNLGTVSIKYFLPGNKTTLITISNDKDLKRMVKFHGNSDTTSIYVLTEVVAPDVSNMPASRSSRTTLSEAGMVLVDAPISHVDEAMDDTTTQPADAAPMDADIGKATGVPQLRPPLDPNDLKLIRAAQQWQNIITGVGQRFKSVHEFREALRKYSIAHQIAFRFTKNESNRVTVRCKTEGCPWIIHALRLRTTQSICIKEMDVRHTCEGGGRALTTGFQATRNWVASILKEKLKDCPKYKPNDIIKDVKEEYGIQLTYFQARRGKEIAREQHQGSYEEAYSQLPFFCEKIMETNPGSLTTFTTKDDSSFHRFFVSFHASLYGFQQGCRPLLFLDSVPLQSKYQGALLAAIAADGDDGVFPVAFAVVDVVTDDNWCWFLLQLKSALSTIQSLTFVADREKGLKESIADIFHDVDVHHGYCIRYLSEQLIRDFKGQYSQEVKRLMVEDLYAAAYAPMPDGFQKCIENIKIMSLEAYNWVMQSEPLHWANAYFRGARYNHMRSDFGELFYNWASDTHDLPITQMVDAIRGKIMELLYTRRADSTQWLMKLTPSMEEKLGKEKLKVRCLQVLKLENEFEVRGESIEFVDIDHWDCSCKGWQLAGLPCCHALAVIGWLDRNPYDYCSRFLTTDSYKLTYSESIHPVPSVDWSMQKDSAESLVTVTPPPIRRPRGRPSNERVGLQEVARRQTQCSRCKGVGHNKSTCKESSLEC